jgi:2-iminoacetate synthase
MQGIKSNSPHAHLNPEDHTGFADVIGQWDWDETIRTIDAVTAADVQRTLAVAAENRRQLTPDEFMTLIAPAAEPFIEEMAALSRRFTLEKFGRTISMYIPMYVSNACSNACVYCGFNHSNPLKRTILDMDAVRNECEAIRKLAPFENLLVVSGEFPSLCGTNYFVDVLKTCRPYFHNLSIEAQPMRTEQYRRLVEVGLNGVVCFQETYHRDSYKQYHPRGMKSIYEWRLNGFDRMGRAGVHKIGLGVLIGLEDWRADVTMMARHLRYLQKHYWQTRYSVNFPRMCPSESGFQPRVIMSDKQLAQLTFAFRIFDHEVDISYSTRETSRFRDNMMTLGVTSMSAGSKTEPGGYFTSPEALEQFEITDARTPQQVADSIRAHGYEPVWKDWDASFDTVQQLTNK